MAQFLTTRGTASQIENIINHAQKRLVLISPYVDMPETLLQTLRAADRRNVRITVVYGKKELHPEMADQLRQLDNLSLLFLENLHAKCYFNEEDMVITSLNLVDYSEQNNREMGVLLNVNNDKEAFGEALKEAGLIVSSAERTDFKGAAPERLLVRTQQGGFCVRCRRPIPHDIDRPLCVDCFQEWAEWGNPDYEESYCHTCGTRGPTTKSKPECYSCYRNSQR